MHPRWLAIFAGLGALDVWYIDFVLGPRFIGMNIDALPASTPAALPAAGVLPALPGLSRPEPAAGSAGSLPASLPAASSAIAPLPAPAAAPEHRGPPGLSWWIVNFPRAGQVHLSSAAQEQLRQIAQRFAGNPAVKLRIVGHADMRGEDDLNQQLGALRAYAVADALERAGASREQIEIASQGERLPAVIGEDVQAWAANRRVEIEAVSVAPAQTTGAKTE